MKNIIFDLGAVIIDINYNFTAEAFKKIGVANFDEIYSKKKQDHFFDDFETGTIGYRALMEMTQMSDFVARYVLWKQYTQNEGMSEEKAIEEVMDTFIVYDVVTNKWVQLANDLGLIMFTKFWLRTQRVIKKLAVDNPLYLALFLLKYEY